VDVTALRESGIRLSPTPKQCRKKCVEKTREHSFNRVGNAPRMGIYPAGSCSRGLLGTHLYLTRSKVTLTRSVSEGRKSQSLVDASGYDPGLTKLSFSTVRSLEKAMPNACDITIRIATFIPQSGKFHSLSTIHNSIRCGILASGPPAQ